MPVIDRIILELKNSFGWKTKRKLVVLSFDDYGNVRVDSKEARQRLNDSGLKVSTRFDAFDSLENREDIEVLYEALSSVKDIHGRHAILTPFSVPCNIDFEEMASTNYSHYIYELLPKTYQKLSSKNPTRYEGAWDLWKKGIAEGLVVPQFHGREHLNLTLFEQKLVRKDPDILIVLKNRCYTSITNTVIPTIKYTAAFDFFELNENERFESVIEDGVKKFEIVFLPCLQNLC